MKIRRCSNCKYEFRAAMDYPCSMCDTSGKQWIVKDPDTLLNIYSKNSL